MKFTELYLSIKLITTETTKCATKRFIAHQYRSDSKSALKLKKKMLAFVSSLKIICEPLLHGRDLSFSSPLFSCSSHRMIAVQYSILSAKKCRSPSLSLLIIFFFCCFRQRNRRRIFKRLSYFFVCLNANFRSKTKTIFKWAVDSLVHKHKHIKEIAMCKGKTSCHDLFAYRLLVSSIIRRLLWFTLIRIEEKRIFSVHLFCFISTYEATQSTNVYVNKNTFFFFFSFQFDYDLEK